MSSVLGPYRSTRNRRGRHHGYRGPRQTRSWGLLCSSAGTTTNTPQSRRPYVLRSHTPVQKEVDLKSLTVPVRPQGLSLYSVPDSVVSVGGYLVTTRPAPQSQWWSVSPRNPHPDRYSKVLTSGDSTLRSDPFDVRVLRLGTPNDRPDSGRFRISTPTDSETPGLGVGSHESPTLYFSFFT